MDMVRVGVLEIFRLMRRRYLDNTTFFFVIPKRVILKRENSYGPFVVTLKSIVLTIG